MLLSNIQMRTRAEAADRLVAEATQKHLRDQEELKRIANENHKKAEEAFRQQLNAQERVAAEAINAQNSIRAEAERVASDLMTAQAQQKQEYEKHVRDLSAQVHNANQQKASIEADMKAKLEEFKKSEYQQRENAMKESQEAAQQLKISEQRFYDEYCKELVAREAAYEARAAEEAERHKAKLEEALKTKNEKLFHELGEEHAAQCKAAEERHQKEKEALRNAAETRHSELLAQEKLNGERQAMELQTAYMTMRAEYNGALSDARTAEAKLTERVNQLREELQTEAGDESPFQSPPRSSGPSSIQEKYELGSPALPPWPFATEAGTGRTVTVAPAQTTSFSESHGNDYQRPAAGTVTGAGGGGRGEDNPNREGDYGGYRGGGGGYEPNDESDDDESDDKKKKKKKKKKGKKSKKSKKDKKANKKKKKSKKNKKVSKRDDGDEPPDGSSSSSSDTSKSSSTSSSSSDNVFQPKDLLSDSSSSSSSDDSSDSSSSSSSSDSDEGGNDSLDRLRHFFKKQDKKRKDKSKRMESIPDKLKNFPTKLPRSTEIRSFKIDLQRSVVSAAKSQGKEARKWVRKCWDPKVKSRVLRKPKKFYWLDHLIREELTSPSMLKDTVIGRRMVNLIRKAEEEGKEITGRSWIRYILKNPVPDQRLKDFFDLSHLMQVQWLGDKRIELFLSIFDFILDGMDPKQKPNKETLHEMLYKQFKKTEALKYDLEYYKRIDLDDPGKAKKVKTYRWIRKRLENFIIREDQEVVQRDWDHEISRITGDNNPAAAGLGFPTQLRDPSNSRRERSGSR